MQPLGLFQNLDSVDALNPDYLAVVGWDMLSGGDLSSMEKTVFSALALALAFGAWVWFSTRGKSNRAVWKSAADNLNLDFESSVWNRKIRMKGVIRGYPLRVEYETMSRRTGSSGGRRQYMHRIYIDATHKLPSDILGVHPQDMRIAVRNGIVSFKPDLEDDKKWWFYLNQAGAESSASQELANIIHSMIDWAEELTAQKSKGQSLNQTDDKQAVLTQ